jgi:hypothetical protein
MSDNEFKAVKDADHPADNEFWGVLHNNEFAPFGPRNFAEKVASEANTDPTFTEDDWNDYIRQPVIAYNPTNRSVILDKR